MKRSALYGFILVLIIAGFIVTAPPVHAQSAGLVSSIINRMERNRRDLRSLRAEISMEKYNAQIGDKDEYKGAVIYLPSGSRSANVRVDWQRPQHETLVVTDGKFTLFRPRLNMAYVGNANSNRNKVSGVLGFGLNITKQQLASRFEQPQNISEETLWGGVRTTHFKLVPRGTAGYKYVEIWIDGDGMPVQTKVVEKNDDATTVRLSNVQRNVQIASDEFRLQLDSNVKKVRS